MAVIVICEYLLKSFAYFELILSDIFLLPLVNMVPTSLITNPARNNDHLVQSSTDLYETSITSITEINETKMTSSGNTTVPYYEYSYASAANPVLSSSAIVCMLFVILVVISCACPLRCCKNVHLDVTALLF